MLLLTSTSDLVQVVTSAAANVLASTSCVDSTSGVLSPYEYDTAAITSATTTTIVPSPGSGVIRTVETLTLRNTSTSVPTNVKLQRYNGTLTIDLTPNVTLLPGESVVFNEDNKWIHLNSANSKYKATMSSRRLSVSGYLAETYPRELCPENPLALISTGQMFLTGVWLDAGMVVSNISFHTGSTASSGQTNWWYALYDPRYDLRAYSADQTTTVMNANTLYTLAMAAPYTVTTSGIFYVAYMMVAATQLPTLKCFTKVANVLPFLPQVINGLSTTGLTTTPPTIATPPSSSATSIPWAGVS